MENLRFTKNQLLKSVKELFLVTEKLIKDQREITGLTTIDCKQLTWRSTVLLCDKAIEITNAKTYVFADSVLCLGGISTEANRIDGEPMAFEWKNFTGFTTMGILEEIHKLMTELQCETEQFKGRIIFMSMYNDIVWGERGNPEKCVKNCITVAKYARKFLPGHWSFLGPGSKLILINRTENGTKLQ